jgi:hypothetical protein
LRIEAHVKKIAQATAEAASALGCAFLFLRPRNRKIRFKKTLTLAGSGLKKIKRVA